MSIDWEELLSCPCGRFRFAPGHLLGRLSGVCPAIEWRRVLRES